jgi:hypothetical protein
MAVSFDADAGRGVIRALADGAATIAFAQMRNKSRADLPAGPAGARL